MQDNSDFPRRDVLERGVLLGSIANAIMIATDSGYARFLSWDGRNYVLNGCDGTYGAMTFDPAGVVGAFFDAQSPFNPFRSKEQYNPNRFFLGMPAELRSLVERETLLYNRQEYKGHLLSLVTAAFWSKGDHLDAALPWVEVLANGAEIIQTELMQDLSKALAEWQDAYQMTTQQVDFARSLFERKMVEPGKLIGLSASDLRFLRAISKGRESMKEAFRAFLPIGIQPPNGVAFEVDG
jgi:hypothetical protein